MVKYIALEICSVHFYKSSIYIEGKSADEVSKTGCWSAHNIRMSLSLPSPRPTHFPFLSSRLNNHH